MSDLPYRIVAPVPIPKLMQEIFFAFLSLWSVLVEHPSIIAACSGAKCFEKIARIVSSSVSIPIGSVVLNSFCTRSTFGVNGFLGICYSSILFMWQSGIACCSMYSAHPYGSYMSFNAANPPEKHLFISRWDKRVRNTPCPCGDDSPIYGGCWHTTRTNFASPSLSSNRDIPSDMCKYISPIVSQLRLVMVIAWLQSGRVNIVISESFCIIVLLMVPLVFVA